MGNNFLMVRVLKECNWTCSYCEYKSNGIIPDEGKAIEIFEKHKDTLTHITGGEPGLLSQKFWDHVFNYKKVGVLTNGLFIKKGYYEKYKDKLTHLYVHVTPELNVPIHPTILKVIRNKDPIVEPSIVIHRKNTSLIKGFLKKFSDIHFNITMSGTQFYPDMGYNITDKDTAIAIIDQLKDFPQYNHFIPKLFKAITSDNWNLCFIPKGRVDKCSECPVKCWVDI